MDDQIKDIVLCYIIVYSFYEISHSFTGVR